MNNTAATRAYCFDNLKFILILCVVLGHLLELWGSFRGVAALYRVIYAFHMPAFLFLNGFFARFNSKKLVCRMVYPYFLFQFLYLLLDHFVLEGGTAADLSLQFTQPYWILWYQLVLIFFSLLLPLLHRLSDRVCIVIVAFSLAASLLAGFVDSIGYFLSLSRFFTFLPFFVLGHLAGRYREPLRRFCRNRTTGRWTAFVLLACGVLVSAIGLWNSHGISAASLYGSFSYRLGSYHMGTKLLLAVIALIWIAFLLLAAQILLSRRIPVISTLGKNTLPVFQLHAALIKLLEHSGALDGIFRDRQPLLVLFALLILLLLGNPAVAEGFRLLFTGWWLERLWNKRSAGRKADKTGYI